MNYSTAVFLINKNARAIMASYEADGPNGQKAARTMFKTLDPTLKVGDLVIVPTNTRHLRTVVKIQEVDVDVNFDGDEKIDWIIGLAPDEAAYKRMLEAEESALRQIRSAELAKKRRDLAAAMLQDVDPTTLQLSAVDVSGVAQLEQKTE